MRTEDLNRLREICEKEGYTVLNHALNVDNLFEIYKKDIWEGVEYVEHCLNNRIHKVVRFYQEKAYVIDVPGLDCYLTEFKPSTESAYIEQLKKIAFEKFGEIRVGDRFDRTNLNDSEIDNIAKIEPCFNEFEYFKCDDSLEFNGTIIYQQGRWAERSENNEPIPISVFINGKEFIEKK